MLKANKTIGKKPSQNPYTQDPPRFFVQLLIGLRYHYISTADAVYISQQAVFHTPSKLLTTFGKNDILKKQIH